MTDYTYKSLWNRGEDRSKKDIAYEKIVGAGKLWDDKEQYYPTRLFITDGPIRDVSVSDIKKIFLSLPEVQNSPIHIRVSVDMVAPPKSWFEAGNNYEEESQQHFDAMVVDFMEDKSRDKFFKPSLNMQKIAEMTNGGIFYGHKLHVRYDPNNHKLRKFCDEKGLIVRFIHKKGWPRYFISEEEADNYTVEMEFSRKNKFSFDRPQETGPIYRYRMLFYHLKNLPEAKDFGKNSRRGGRDHRAARSNMSFELKNYSETIKDLVMSCRDFPHHDKDDFFVWVDFPKDPNDSSRVLDCAIVDIVDKSRGQVEVDFDSIYNELSTKSLYGNPLLLTKDAYNRNVASYIAEHFPPFLCKISAPPQGRPKVFKSQEAYNIDHDRKLYMDNVEWSANRKSHGGYDSDYNESAKAVFRQDNNYHDSEVYYPNNGSHGNNRNNISNRSIQNEGVIQRTSGGRMVSYNYRMFILMQSPNDKNKLISTSIPISNLKNFIKDKVLCLQGCNFSTKVHFLIDPLTKCSLGGAIVELVNNHHAGEKGGKPMPKLEQIIQELDGKILITKSTEKVKFEDGVDSLQIHLNVVPDIYNQEAEKFVADIDKNYKLHIGIPPRGVPTLFASVKDYESSLNEKESRLRAHEQRMNQQKVERDQRRKRDDANFTSIKRPNYQNRVDDGPSKFQKFTPNRNAPMQNQMPMNPMQMQNPMQMNPMNPMQMTATNPMMEQMQQNMMMMSQQMQMMQQQLAMQTSMNMKNQMQGQNKWQATGSKNEGNNEEDMKKLAEKCGVSAEVLELAKKIAEKK